MAGLWSGAGAGTSGQRAGEGGRVSLTPLAKQNNIQQRAHSEQMNEAFLKWYCSNMSLWRLIDFKQICVVA